MTYFESNHPKSKVKTPRNFEKRGKLLSTLFLFLASQLIMLKRIKKKEGFLRVTSPLGRGFESNSASISMGIRPEPVGDSYKHYPKCNIHFCFFCGYSLHYMSEKFPAKCPMCGGEFGLLFSFCLWFGRFAFGGLSLSILLVGIR